MYLVTIKGMRGVATLVVDDTDMLKQYHVVILNCQKVQYYGMCFRGYEEDDEPIYDAIFRNENCEYFDGCGNPVDIDAIEILR